jgi:hypothetical protein
MYLEDELQEFIEVPFPRKSLITSIVNQQIMVKVKNEQIEVKIED